MTVAGPVLRDIHVPPAAWWPPAPGWWLVAALVLLAAAAAAWWWRRHVRRRPLAAALREIDALAAAFERDRDATRLVDGASRLLRRVACRVNPAKASQSGEAWREFLHAGSADPGVQRALDALVDARFRAHPAPDAPALLAALRVWCKAALRVGGGARKRVVGAGTREADDLATAP